MPREENIFKSEKDIERARDAVFERDRTIVENVPILNDPNAGAEVKAAAEKKIVDKRQDANQVVGEGLGLKDSDALNKLKGDESVPNSTTLDSQTKAQLVEKLKQCESILKDAITKEIGGEDFDRNKDGSLADTEKNKSRLSKLYDFCVEKTKKKGEKITSVSFFNFLKFLITTGLLTTGLVFLTKALCSIAESQSKCYFKSLKGDNPVEIQCDGCSYEKMCGGCFQGTLQAGASEACCSFDCICKDPNSYNCKTYNDKTKWGPALTCTSLGDVLSNLFNFIGLLGGNLESLLSKIVKWALIIGGVLLFLAVIYFVITRFLLKKRNQ